MNKTKKKRIYTKEQVDKKKEFSRKWRIKLRTKIINHYGGCCNCCGEHRYEFLCIDHKFGGGNAERSTKRPDTIWRNIVNNNYPAEYRILCHNCNQSLGAYGYCPHNNKKRITKYNDD